jgi:hypothetical protein
MTRARHSDGPAPDWDLRVLDVPVVLHIPEHIPPHPDPLLVAAVETLLATAAGEHSASRRISHLGRAGVVAIRTSAGSLELRETLLGWILVRGDGTPDPSDLAGAARLRAWRLAAERRSGCGGPPPEGPERDR